MLFQRVSSESAAVKPFRESPEPPSTLRTRMRELAKDNLLIENGQFGFNEAEIVAIQAFPAKRVYVPSKKRTEEFMAVSAQMGTNYARMEVEGQPPIGWSVNVAKCTCGCRYWLRFGFCVHLLYALQRSALVDSMGHEVLFDRSRSWERTRHSERQSERRVGRTLRICPALALD
ncbi:hypothetical protein PHMEG_00016703 [Phytophthora megakarya]|uniref:SWIM-type domain-containing protein n=1 Tax=Phytophthora megakarya TaxID=4795 RepID=A0A225VZ84_9STRA|nr:hypothetical protein PHMEG_00016703 [Phytophthora megakarya]